MPSQHWPLYSVFSPLSLFCHALMGEKGMQVGEEGSSDSCDNGRLVLWSPLQGSTTPYTLSIPDLHPGDPNSFLVEYRDFHPAFLFNGLIPLLNTPPTSYVWPLKSHYRAFSTKALFVKAFTCLYTPTELLPAILCICLPITLPQVRGLPQSTH